MGQKITIKILDRNGSDVTSGFQKTQNSGAVVYEAVNGQDDAYVLVC